MNYKKEALRIQRSGLRKKTRKAALYIPAEEPKTRPDGKISANGTKPIDTFGKFISQTHVIAPVCNKGAYQVMSIKDITTIGKKV